MGDPAEISISERVHRRAGHIALTVHDNDLLIWGGYVEHVQGAPQEAIRSNYHSTDEVWMHDTLTGAWTRHVTTGEIPPRNSGACAVVVESDKIYVFGGYQGALGANSGNTNELFMLNLQNYKWERVQHEGPAPLPCDKMVGWFHSGKVYFFGGFGPPRYPENVPNNGPKWQHVIDETTIGGPLVRGWNNQLVAFDISTKKWTWPETSGYKPCPRAAHASGKTGDLVFIFGGRFRNSRMKDLHCLNLKTMTWSGDLSQETNLQRAEGDVPPPVHWPGQRSWSSLTFTSRNVAVLYGGFSHMNTVLNDCWILLLNRENGKQFPNITWKEASLPYDHGEPRCWHGACLLGNGDLAIHSGVTQPFYETHLKLRDHCEELLLLRTSPLSLVQLCLIATNREEKRLKSSWITLPKTLATVLYHRSGDLSNTVDYWELVDPMLLQM